MSNIINFFKQRASFFSKLILTIYLTYGSIALHNIDISALKHPLELFIIISVQIAYNSSIAIYIYFLWKGGNKNSLSRDILIYSVIFIILSFPTTYGILLLGKQLSSIDGVKIGTADGWLSFIGSLLGGIITMTALLFTIKHEKNIRQEEAQDLKQQTAFQTIPIIIVQVPPISKEYKVTYLNSKNTSETTLIKDPKIEQFYKENFENSGEDFFNKFPILFEILNTSENHGMDIEFTKFEIYQYFQHYYGLNKSKQILIHNGMENINEIDINCNILPGKYNKEFHLNLDYEHIKVPVLKFLIVIDYYDIQRLKQHRTESEIILKFNNSMVKEKIKEGSINEIKIEYVKNSSRFIF